MAHMAQQARFPTTRHAHMIIGSPSSPAAVRRPQASCTPATTAWGRSIGPCARRVGIGRPSPVRAGGAPMVPGSEPSPESEHDGTPDASSAAGPSPSAGSVPIPASAAVKKEEGALPHRSVG